MNRDEYELILGYDELYAVEPEDECEDEEERRYQESEDFCGGMNDDRLFWTELRWVPFRADC